MARNKGVYAHGTFRTNIRGYFDLLNDDRPKSRYISARSLARRADIAESHLHNVMAGRSVLSKRANIRLCGTFTQLGLPVSPRELDPEYDSRILGKFGRKGHKKFQEKMENIVLHSRGEHSDLPERVDVIKKGVRKKRSIKAYTHKVERKTVISDRMKVRLMREEIRDLRNRLGDSDIRPLCERDS